MLNKSIQRTRLKYDASLRVSEIYRIVQVNSYNLTKQIVRLAFGALQIYDRLHELISIYEI